MGRSTRGTSGTTNIKATECFTTETAVSMKATSSRGRLMAEESSLTAMGTGTRESSRIIRKVAKGFSYLPMGGGMKGTFQKALCMVMGRLPF
eukprot:CAMPEP_0201284926 /NCGR_PEP_ID=MMETSP1317-20130820/89094_1 /ASSEMBLY_ACC=CAM_ASM_000770 /TAXON_ID=187299 /ORGANISM="Undescribed Undescribed, Strain Undescribed" /LENGTH=91 /DNA_ID=CAMNT_0047607141 /DNA_START=43 /DNA_END=318 /DNA_ORIENTATION=+